MTQNERHEQILRRLAITRQVLVKDLAREFEVTEDCIRKDLTALEKQGQLRRIHGGAVSVRSNFHIMKVCGLRMKVRGSWMKICGLWMKVCGLWIRLCGLPIRTSGMWR